MASHNYGSISDFNASLSSDFGLNLAKKWFNMTEEELEAIFGRFVRGKNKGLLRGAVNWKRVTHGGWFHLINGGGFVCPSTKVIFQKELVLPVWGGYPEVKKAIWKGLVRDGACHSNSEGDDLADAWKEYRDSMEELKKQSTM